MAKRSPFVEGEENIFFSGIVVSANFAEKSFGQTQDAGADVIGELGDHLGQERDHLSGLDVNLKR